MSYKRGPNIVTDGLILYLDPANVKSFKGEPTTNLLTYGSNFISTPWYGYCGNLSNVTYNSTDILAPDNTYSALKVVRNNQFSCGASTTWGMLYSSSGVLTSGNVYTASIWARCASGTATLIFGLNDYYLTTVTLTTEWQNFSATFTYTPPSQTDRVFEFYSPNLNMTYYVWNAQTELKPYSTPFVNGTRGTTIATGGGLKDLTSNGNNGEVVNGLKYSSNNKGSLAFDGVNDVIILGPSSQFLSVYHTYEAWIKTSGLGASTLGGIFGISYGLIINLVSGGNLQYTIYSNESSSYVIYDTSVGVNLFDNKWHHIVCTRGPSTYGIYIDGVLNKSGGSGSWTGTNIWAAMNAQIGNNPNDVNFYYYGEMTGIKIYNRDLSSDEVFQNYNATKSRFGII